MVRIPRYSGRVQLILNHTKIARLVGCYFNYRDGDDGDDGRLIADIRRLYSACTVPAGDVISHCTVLGIDHVAACLSCSFLFNFKLTARFNSTRDLVYVIILFLTRLQL